MAVAPPSADLAAQAFRADLFAREGFTVLSTAWYGGHHTPGYSVVAPALGAWLGVEVTGALAVIAATWLMGLLAGPAAASLVVPALLATVVSGRTTFALGAAVGLAAVLAAQRGRTALALLGGAATALASPVAALFAGIAGAAFVLDRAGGRVRSGFALGAGAAATTLFLVVAFPEGGTFPFVASSFLPVFAVAAAAAWLAPPGPLRIGAALYALIALAVFLLPSPIGGNAARLATLVAAPVLVLLVWPRSKVAVGVLALPLAYFVLQAPVRDVLRAHDDPSTEAAFHQPLVDWLEQYGGTRRVRIAVPLTQNHGEANHLARHVALARGWERQVDRERGELFYDGELDPLAYLAWLRENGVTFIAVPEGVPFDAAGEEEARVAAETSIELTRLPGWRVYTPVGAGRLGVDRLDPDAFTASRSGVVKVRWSPYWVVTEGRGCVERAPGDWTRVTVRGAAPVRVTTRFSPARIRAEAARCR